MIREFREGDEVAVAKLERESFSHPWSEDAVLSSFASGVRFYVFEKCGRILGYVGLQTVLDEGYITNIAVDTGNRRQGIGRELLKELDEVSKELSLSFISLEVRESNLPAIELYKSLGYKNEGLRRGFYEDPCEDAIIMTKRR